MRVSVCTTVVHNTARSSFDCLPSPRSRPENHHSSDAVLWTGTPENRLVRETKQGAAGRGGWSRAVYVTHHRQTRPRRQRQRDRQTERERERERGSRVIHKHSCVVQRLDGDESRATLNFVNNHRDALLARADNESAWWRCIHRRTSCMGSDVPLHTACSM